MANHEISPSDISDELFSKMRSDYCSFNMYNDLGSLSMDRYIMAWCKAHKEEL